MNLQQVATVLGQAISDEGAALPVLRAVLESVDGQVQQEASVMTNAFRHAEAGTSSLFAFLAVMPATEVDERLVLRVFGPDGEYAFLRQSFVPRPGGVLLALE